VRLEACGICHTDLHIRRGQEPLDAEALPRVLGHEGIGRVVAVGREESGSLIGTRVGVPWIHDTCGRCRQCLSGAEAYCGAQRANGYDVDGAFAEYCLLSESFLVPVLEGLDPIAAAPLLCAGVTALGGVRRARLRPGSLCAIFGVGGLGQYGIQIAKASGAVVAAVDTAPDKLEVAAGLGADHLLLADADPGRRLQELGGADACINFAPSSRVWDQIMEATNPQAWIVSVAMVPDPVPLSLRRLTFTGENITGNAVGGRQDLADVMALAERSGLAVDVRPVALDDADAVLDDLAAGKSLGRSVIDLRAG
jgi:propanol-preferring alcohol dehydrogenase